MTKRKKEVIVPLMRKGDATVSFDYDKEVLYLIHWKLDFTEFTSSFSMTYILLGIASVLGLVLDRLFTFSNILPILFALLVGISVEKTITVNFINSIVKEKEYRRFKKNEVEEVIRTVKTNYTVLRIVDVLIKIATLFMLLILSTHEIIKGRDIMMSFVVGMSFFVLNDCVQFRLSFQAVKELKKQLKQGAFG